MSDKNHMSADDEPRRDIDELADEAEARAAFPESAVATTLVQPVTEVESAPATRTVPRGLGHVAEPDNDHWWRSWLGRTCVALGGVLVLTTGLIWAWVGGLTNPVARDVPVAVISSDATANGVLAALAQQTSAIHAVRYANANAVDSALTKRRVEAILASDATDLRGGLNLTIAGGAGPGIAETVTTAIGAAANALTIPLTVEDVHPLSAGDPRGLTPFYLVLGWVIGGLIAAIVLGIALGTVPRNLDRLGSRLAALAVFALALGLLGALVAGPILGVWHRHTVGLWLSGAFITITVALITSALQSWLGLWGVGISVVLVIVLGVPGSGGSVAWELLPGFFRDMRGWIPNGLGTDLVRGVEYFGRAANTWPITGLTMWALGSIVALLGSTVVLGRRAREAAGFGPQPRHDDPDPDGAEVATTQA